MRPALGSLLCAAVLLSPPDAGAARLTCESRGMQRQECPLEWPGEVQMLEQLSRSDCARGRSWGVEDGNLWVDHGCRAVFETAGAATGDSAFTSEAFPPGLPRRVACESRNRQRSDCDMDTRGEVRLVRRLSSARCEQGESWGLFRHTVWVDRGCRAVFESKGTDYDHPPNRLPGWAVRACNSVEYDHGRVVVWSNPRPGTYEITLEDRQGRFQCSVESGGVVKHYERSGNADPGHDPD